MQAMRIVFILSFLILFLGTSHGQSIDKFYKWDVSVSYALQEHDKRLYDWPKIPKKAILERQPERWGTHWYRLTVHRNILESKNFKLKGGIGYTSEYRTFNRPYDYCIWFPEYGNACPDVLDFTNGYRLNYLNIPMEYNYYLVKGLSIDLSVAANFVFYKHPTTQELPFGSGLFMFKIHKLSVLPGVSYDFGRFIVKADYRAFQLKNIDDVIFYDGLFKTTPDPREDGMFETYNPLHFRITLSYEFGEQTFEEE